MGQAHSGVMAASELIMEGDAKDKKSKSARSDTKKVSKRNLDNALSMPTDDGSTAASSDTDANTTSMISRYRVSRDSLKVLASRSITTFFPIQGKTFDVIFDGYHVIGRARTGTGKTLAFALPTVEANFGKSSSQASRRPSTASILVLLPTRELAQQVAEDFVSLECGRFGTVAVVGGLPEDPQIRALKQKGDVVVGTPGRVLDFLRRNILSVSQLKVLVLDEADQMLEMGFREDVDAVLEHVTEQRQTAGVAKAFQVLLFSATLPSWISTISAKYMSQGEKRVVDVVHGEKIQTAVGVQHLAIMCSFHQRSLVLDSLLALYGRRDGRTIIFVETKALANEIAMNSSISNRCQVLHGDIQQQQRETTLKAFRSGVFNCLVATDVAARGIHVDDVSLVIHMEPPKDVDTFVHRSGRTGRAGTSGTNIVLFRSLDTPFLLTIEKTTGIKFKRVGVPQPRDLLQSAALAIAERTLSIEEGLRISDATRQAAELLIAELGPSEAVARLLFEVVGNLKTDLMISALTGRENQQTYQIVFKTAKIHTKSYVWQALNNALGSEKITSAIGPMMLRADSTGAVFDVPKHLITEFDKLVETASRQTRNSASFTITTVSELPEIYDPQFDASTVAACTDSRNPNSRGKRFRDTNGRNDGGRHRNPQDFRTSQPAFKQQRTLHGATKQW